MRPDIPWNVAGIPLEAREAARVAARREGLSVGEWMTRRILRSFSDGSEDVSPPPAWTANGSGFAAPATNPTTRRDTEDMLAHVSRSETESGEVFRRIEEQLRGVARRLEAAERSQSENHRAMSKAASEINIAAREQAQAFDQLGNSVVGLADRIDRVERQSAQDGLKDAVKGLHQGLTRVADQIAATANQSASQISALANNLESVAGRAGQARIEAEAAARAFEQRLAQIDERVRSAERLAQASHETIQHALSNLEVHKSQAGAPAGSDSDTTAAIGRLEAHIAKLEAAGSDPNLDHRLSSIERSLSEIANRFEKPTERPSLVAGDLKRLSQLVDTKEEHEPVAKSRVTVDDAAAHDTLPESASHLIADIAAPAEVGAPPFAEPSVPDNAPPFQRSALPFAATADSVHDVPVADVAGDAAHINPNIADEPMNLRNEESTADSYLSAARRSARAASAQAEVERGIRSGAFSWGTTSASIAATVKPEARKPYVWIGLIAALTVVAVGAGVVMSQKLNVGSSRSFSTLLNKTAETAPASSVRRASPVPLASPSVPETAAAPQINAVVVHDGAPSEPTAPVVTDATGATTHATTVPAIPLPPAARIATAAPPARGSATLRPATTASLSPLDKLTALANSGNAKAELVVGLKYLDGDGIAVNEVDAAKWLGRAAGHGQAVAQYRLGTMYDRGRGVAADPLKAAHWYLLASQAGNRKAMHNLAVAYASGTGVPKNLAEAARWFSKAAALGLSDSQFNLAVLYERGLGVPQSLLDAYKWYAIAAAAGDTESKARTEALATQLSADDRAAAQRAATAFRAQPLDVKANVAPLMSDVTG